LRRANRHGDVWLMDLGEKRERIVISRDIEVVVLSISGNRVKLGIKAADGVSAWRKELVHRSNRSSSRKPR